MTEQTLKDKTAKGIFWGGISNGAVQILSLSFGIYLSRTLAPYDYGIVAALAIFSGIATSIIKSGFTVALINKKDATHEDYNAVFWFTVITGILIYIILFFSAPLIADFYKKPELTNLARVFFIAFLFGGIGSVPHTVMFKQLMAKKQAKIEIVCVIISGIVGVCIAMNGFGYWALALQSVTWVTLNAIISYLVAPWKPSLNINFSPLKHFLSFGSKIFLTNIITQINDNIYSTFFAKIYTFEQAGFYNQGQKWMSMCRNFLNGMINTVAQPVIVNIRDENERLLNVFRKLIRFISFISFPTMFGLALVSSEFIIITIGEKWLPVVPLLQILCVMGAFAPLNLICSQLIISFGKSNIFLTNTAILGICQILILFALSSYGLVTMVTVYASLNIIWLFIWHYFVSILIHYSFTNLLKDISPYVAVTLFVLIIAYLTTITISNIYVLLILKIAISVLLYIFIMKLGKSKTFEESLHFLKTLRKNRQ